MFRVFAQRIVLYYSHNRNSEMRMIRENFPDTSDVMLDGGVGRGMFSNFLSKQFRIVGLDINPVGLKQAKELGVDSIVCDLAQIPIRDDCIPYILSNSVMEHVPDVKGAMEEYGRVAKSGAIMILTVPTDADGMLVRKMTRVVFQINHNLSSSTWWGLVEGAGFEVLREIRYQHKEIHDIYIISCIFLPLFLLSRFFLYLIKKLPEKGVSMCLVSKKV